MVKIYGDVRSGNCFKVKLVCELLNVDYQWIDVDIMQGQTKTVPFIKMNPSGKIPFAIFDDTFQLSESNAIINYIAHGSSLYPLDSKCQALVQQWQFFEQYSHEPYIAVARFINKYLGLPDEKKEEFEGKQIGGIKALTVMEGTLSKQPFLIGQDMTTADIALFAYTHVAEEGGFNLDNFPAIKQWINRIEQRPNYTHIG